MKIKILAILSVCLMLFSTTPAWASENISIYINEELQSYDVAPQIIDGRTMLPMRAIFESLGASVFWNDKDRQVLAKKDKTEVLLTVGEEKVYINDKEETLDVVPIIIGGRTLVPVRFVSEALGAKVDWDEANRSVLISAEAIAKTEEIYSHKVISVNAIGHDGNVPQNSVDGKDSTRWSHEGGESWIIFEFEKALPLDYVGCIWYYGDERKESFEIHTSLDGVNYKMVADHKSEMTLDMAGYDAGDGEAKFVKLICKGNSSNLWNSLCEIKFYPPHESGEMVVDAPASLNRDGTSKELLDILSKFDKEFDMDFLYWIASLYDRESGGFYWSTSAKDYPGYYADIEGTVSAIDIMRYTKLWDVEAEEEGMIPDWFIDNLSNFAIERQNPEDGHFYDPQWGYEINDFKKSRNLFQSLGIIAVKDDAKPKYKTPTERLAELNSGSATSAEVKVDERFVSAESTRAWLDENWKSKSTYEAASSVAAAWSIIEGAGQEEVVRAFFREKQNPETGLFGEGLDLAALNASMKASCAFNTPEAPYPNYQKALKNIAIVTQQVVPASAPEVWNPLSLIQRIVSSNTSNITVAEMEELDNSLAGIFEAVYSHFIKHFQPDGGASTYREGSQNAGGDARFVDACPGGQEGDTGGANMIIRVRNYAYTVAGLPAPQLYTKEQKQIFWDLIRNSKPVEKKEIYTSIYDDFEEYEVKDLLATWRAIQRNDTTVHLDKKNIGIRDTDNTCMRFDCGTAGGNTYLSRFCFTPENYKTVIAKYKIFIAGDGGYFSSYMGTGHRTGKIGFQFLIDARNKKNAVVYSQTGTKTNKIMTLNVDEWYEFEIRYTPGDKNNIVQFYVDGENKYSGNDYYNMGDENKSPAKVVDGIGFMKYHASTGDLYIDNLEYYYE